MADLSVFQDRSATTFQRTYGKLHTLRVRLDVIMLYSNLQFEVAVRLGYEHQCESSLAYRGQNYEIKMNKPNKSWKNVPLPFTLS